MATLDSRVATVVFRRFIMRVAEVIAERRKIPALVTGESVGQVASQTLKNIHVIAQTTTLPILRPLIGMDKAEIIEVAQAIGTFELSVQPYRDPCSLHAQRPSIWSHIEDVIEVLKRSTSTPCSGRRSRTTWKRSGSRSRSTPCRAGPERAAGRAGAAQANPTPGSIVNQARSAILASHLCCRMEPMQKWICAHSLPSWMPPESSAHPHPHLATARRRPCDGRARWHPAALRILTGYLAGAWQRATSLSGRTSREPLGARLLSSSEDGQGYGASRAPQQSRTLRVRR